jgi:hypothetical protein
VRGQPHSAQTPALRPPTRVRGQISVLGQGVSVCGVGGLMVTAKPVKRRMSHSPQRSGVTVSPPHGAGSAPQCSNTRVAATHTRPWSNISARTRGRLSVRSRGGHGNGQTGKASDEPFASAIGRDCLTTAWCGASLTALKHPRCGHPHDSVVKYQCSPRIGRLSVRVWGAHGNGQTGKASDG